ncbi:unnamed protein product [Cyprideis torosa]|uniref:Uncharacterized protein n=1 Tax=Cyprideis torosa TaxID=163714 RepID=A0A7R8ZQ60_9CRUS|nr:unnamed protein product [Cyprideis torosa]CAG0891377.1 unnamed protein product [Cyprideis torosa]
MDKLDQKHIIPWRAVCLVIASVDMGFSVGLVIVVMLFIVVPTVPEIPFLVLAACLGVIAIPFAIGILVSAWFDCKGPYLFYVLWKPIQVSGMITLVVLACTDEKLSEQIAWLVFAPMVLIIIILFDAFSIGLVIALIIMEHGKSYDMLIVAFTVAVVIIAIPFAVGLIIGAGYDCKGSYIPYVFWKPFHVGIIAVLCVLTSLQVTSSEHQGLDIFLAVIRGLIALYHMFAFTWVFFAIIFQRSPWCTMASHLGGRHPPEPPSAPPPPSSGAPPPPPPPAPPAPPSSPSQRNIIG